MKRNFCLLLILTVCLVVVGCRRGSSTKRAPVFVKDEIELLVPPNEAERMFKLLPPDRKYALWLETIPEIEDRVRDEGKRKVEFSNTASAQDDMEKDEKQKDVVASKKAAAALKETRYEFEYFAPWVLKFIKEKKNNPKEFNQVDFYTFVRRGEGVYIRKFFDKVDKKVTEEQVRLIKLIDPPTLVFVPEIDPREEDYIIAYRDAAGGGGGMLGVGGPPGAPPGGGGPPGAPGGGGGAAGPSKYVWFNKANGLDQTFDGDSLKTKLKHQDLRLVRTNFINFCRANYLRPPATPEEMKQWVDINNPVPYRDYDAALEAMTYSRPPTGPKSVLSNFERTMAQLVKTPPDPFDTGKFKKFLEENAPPSMSEKLTSKEISYNPIANLHNPNELIACRNEMEVFRDKDTVKELGHWAISVSGELQLVPTAKILDFAPGPPPKKQGQGGPFGP